MSPTNNSKSNSKSLKDANSTMSGDVQPMSMPPVPRTVSTANARSAQEELRYPDGGGAGLGPSQSSVAQPRPNLLGLGGRILSKHHCAHALDIVPVPRQRRHGRQGHRGPPRRFHDARPTARQGAGQRHGLPAHRRAGRGLPGG